MKQVALGGLDQTQFRPGPIMFGCDGSLAASLRPTDRFSCGERHAGMVS